MAFASAILTSTGGSEVFGGRKVVFGTFTNTGGSTGGDISTGLTRVDAIFLTHTGSSVVASAPVVNETLPLRGSAVTIVTVADADGNWMALGE